MSNLEKFFKNFLVGSHIKSFDVIMGPSTHTVIFKSNNDVSFGILSQYGPFGSAFVNTSWGERIVFSIVCNIRTINNLPFTNVHVDASVKDVNISVEHNEYRVVMVLDDNKEISIILRDPLSLEMDILERMNKE